MTEQATAGEAAEVAPETTTEEEVVERDYEADARKYGWRPKEEFKGPKDRWKDAETFVRDSEENLHVVRSVLDSERKEHAERLARVERAATAAYETAKRNFDQKTAELENQLRYFASKGDLSSFDQVNKQLKDFTSNAPQLPEAVGRTPDEIFQADNPWYGADLAMTGYAEKYSQRLASTSPGLGLEENLRQTKAAVMQEFPHKFANGSPRGKFPAVDAGSSFPSAGRKNGNRKTGADLPSDVRSIGERFVKQGLFKSLDEYATDYFSAENAR